jgi:hypothetical protein
VETLWSGLATAFRELQEQLATVPANRRVEALTAAKNLVDTATCRAGSFRVGAGGEADDTDPELTQPDGLPGAVQAFL